MVQKPVPATGRPLEFEPAKARDAIMHLFWEKGYEAVSLQDIEKRTGLGRSSLYNSFGPKEVIFNEALDKYRQEIGSEMCRPLESGSRGLEDVIEFLEAATTCFASSESTAGCLLVNSMMEFAGSNESVMQQGAQHMVRLRRALGMALDRAAQRREISAHQLGLKADLLLGLLLGISVAARAGMPQQEVQKLSEAARQQVMMWMPLAERRRSSPRQLPLERLSRSCTNPRD